MLFIILIFFFPNQAFHNGIQASQVCVYSLKSDIYKVTEEWNIKSVFALFKYPAPLVDGTSKSIFAVPVWATVTWTSEQLLRYFHLVL